MAATCDSHSPDSYFKNAKDFKSIELELSGATAFKVPAKKICRKISQ
jgi:hypothetical protein